MRAALNNGMTANLKMDDGVYRLRREVIGFIYEAKEVVEIPRIEVRITTNHETMLGCARMNANVLWITERAIKDDWDLRAVVYHEIAHACFGTKHVAGCKLMNPESSRKKMTKREAQALLAKYASETK